MGMTLLEGHYYAGNMIGPGKSVELPGDLPAVVRDRIMRAEYKAQQEAREAMVAGTSMLPEGHPYRQFAANAGILDEPTPPAPVAPGDSGTTSDVETNDGSTAPAVPSDEPGKPPANPGTETKSPAIRTDSSSSA